MCACQNTKRTFKTSSIDRSDTVTALNNVLLNDLLRHRQDLNLRGHCPLVILCHTVETDIAFNDISADIFLLIFTYQIFTVDSNHDRFIDQVPIKFTVTRSKLCSSFLKSARPSPQNLAPICAECRHDGERDDMAVSITSQRDLTSPSVRPTSTQIFWSNPLGAHRFKPKEITPR